MKPDHERVTKLLTDTVTLLCKNGLSYDRELRIQGLLGITVDNSEVFLVSISDSFNCSSPSSLASTASSSDAGGSSRSGMCSVDEIVDLTRLVETPYVSVGVRPSQVSPLHHGTQTRPRSAGSASQTRSRAITPSTSNMTLTHQSQPSGTRLPSYNTAMTAAHHSSTTGRRHSSEHLASASNQHDDAVTSINGSVMRTGPRPYAGYVDSVYNLAQACEMNLPPERHLRGQHYRHLPPTGTSGWSGTEQQQQHQWMHRLRATVSAAAAACRAGTEHFSIPSQPQRQRMVPSRPSSVLGTNLLQYMDSNAVQGPPLLSRHPVQQATVYRDPSPYVGSMQQMHPTAQRIQLVESATVQPPAKRHAPNHMPRQAAQSFIPAIMQNQLTQPHSQSTSHSQLAYYVSAPHVLTSPPATPHTSCVTSSPAIKPPSSPVQSGRRPRPRQVEHIDLCNEDETADSGIHIPVSSIVIQPENFDPSAEYDEVEQSNVSVNTSEFEALPENSLTEDLPPLSRIHEIVPLDDGFDNQDDEFMMVQNTITAGDAECVNTPVSVAVVRDELSESRRSILPCHSDAQPSTAQADISMDILPPNPIGIDAQLARLSADESREIAQLFFDPGGSDMHADT